MTCFSLSSCNRSVGIGLSSENSVVATQTWKRLFRGRSLPLHSNHWCCCWRVTQAGEHECQQRLDEGGRNIKRRACAIKRRMEASRGKEGRIDLVRALVVRGRLSRKAANKSAHAGSGQTEPRKPRINLLFQYASAAPAAGAA